MPLMDQLNPKCSPITDMAGAFEALGSLRAIFTVRVPVRGSPWPATPAARARRC